MLLARQGPPLIRLETLALEYFQSSQPAHPLCFFIFAFVFLRHVVALQGTLNNRSKALAKLAPKSRRRRGRESSLRHMVNFRLPSISLVASYPYQSGERTPQATIIVDFLSVRHLPELKSCLNQRSQS